MDNPTTAGEPLVPPVLDQAELIGVSNADEIAMDAENTMEPATPLDTAEQQGLVLGDSNPPPEGRAGTLPPVRPGLRRDNSVPSPAPLYLPPPAPPAPPAEVEQSAPTDSLSLAQLQRLVSNLPSAEPAPYTFQYDDASSFEEEMEEWFSYSLEEQAMLLKTHTSFSSDWGSYMDRDCDWNTTDLGHRKGYIQSLLDQISHSDPSTRLTKLEALVHILLGCWYETAGLPRKHVEGASTAKGSTDPNDPGHTAPCDKSGLQADMIRENVRLLLECEGLQIVVDSMRSAFRRAASFEVDALDRQDSKDAERRELWCAMTSVYTVLEVARIEEKEKADLSLRAKVLSLRGPSLFILLAELIEKMRWDETISVPLPKVFLLAWKTQLVTFGGLSEVDKAKDKFADKTLDAADDRGQPIITASPLDYHLFRQEISSKYPAYNPPPPLFPLEPENNSILPPLKNHPNKATGNHIFGSGLGDMAGNNTSIFQQPVHIATPAPSPPPSPGVPGGKGGKKPNYQTNQMFPFLYPPLDESSNKLGGKGSTDLQDLLVGRKWEGSDIPTSILEAAELFSKRMRATRAMKQLWEERVQFMKYERGWSGADENFDVSELSLEPKEGDAEKKPPPPGSVEERLGLVEECYRTTLPHLQSLVIVMIKALLSHVTSLVTRATNANGLQSGFQYQENGQPTNGTQNNIANENGTVSTNEEIEAMRTQEILDKAVCGLLLLMLKWFKVSHVLKFEYVTQLLVDSSYVPLILKLLQLQEVDKIVNSKCEQEELNFFNFCRTHSRNAAEEGDEPPQEHPGSDSDDALPPPIRLRREEAPEEATEQVPTASTLPPEVDELGIPISELPKEPITNYSWRAFFTSINVLRIMQKVCKNKAHRNLMLVSYKSTTFLRKSLKVPQPMLRLYTLKLFKNQVPYCGRKWRQNHMRVITAVYLHCRPELRDDWLAGSDVDAEVDESVPLEQALRALTHWFNLKRYPEAMGAKAGVLDEDQDFFRRELEKMDWGEEGADGDADGQGWDVQLEGW